MHFFPFVCLSAICSFAYAFSPLFLLLQFDPSFQPLHSPVLSVLSIQYSPFFIRIQAPSIPLLVSLSTSKSHSIHPSFLSTHFSPFHSPFLTLLSSLQPFQSVLLSYPSSTIPSKLFYLSHLTLLNSLQPFFSPFPSQQWQPSVQTFLPAWATSKVDAELETQRGKVDLRADKCEWRRVETETKIIGGAGDGVRSRGGE